jgi:hypothetical protein
MTVRYHCRGTRPGPDYVCQKDAIEQGRPRCQSINGEQIDRSLGALLIQTMTPTALWSGCCHPVLIADRVPENLPRRGRDRRYRRLGESGRSCPPWPCEAFDSAPFIHRDTASSRMIPEAQTGLTVTTVLITEHPQLADAGKKDGRRWQQWPPSLLRRVHGCLHRVGAARSTRTPTRHSFRLRHSVGQL